MKMVLVAVDAAAVVKARRGVHDDGVRRVLGAQGVGQLGAAIDEDGEGVAATASFLGVALERSCEPRSRP